jgi:hypothetical protein
MPKAKKEVAPESPEAEVTQPVANVPETSEPKPKKAKKTSFAVYNGAELVRTYSVELHGANAEDLAEEFAKHTGFTIV